MELRGSIPAAILPLLPDGSIDELEFRRHLDWLASRQGVGGVTVNGHAGEVASLSRNERRRVLAIAAETVAGRVPVIAGIYAENWTQAVELAGDAQRENADALLMFPLNILLFDGARELAVHHFHEVASRVDLPMVVFVYPEWTRMQYDADALARILAVPSVTAVKDWSLDIRIYEQNLALIRAADHPISMLSSFSTNLLPSLVLGADGILSGHGSVIADIQAELLEAVWTSNLQQAREISARVQKLTGAIYRSPMADMYTRMKEQLVLLGRQERAVVRPPLLPLGTDEKRALERTLVDAGLLQTDADLLQTVGAR